MNEVAERIRSSSENDADAAGGKGSANARKTDVEARLAKAKERQAKLLQRHTQLQQKLSRAGGKPLNGKEKAWISETRRIESSLGTERQKADDNDARQLLYDRVNEVQSLAEEMLQQARDSGKLADKTGGDSNGYHEVPSSVRRDRVARLEDMLDHETALISTAMTKLVRLGIAAEP